MGQLSGLLGRQLVPSRFPRGCRSPSCAESHHQSWVLALSCAHLETISIIFRVVWTQAPESQCESSQKRMYKSECFFINLQDFVTVTQNVCYLVIHSLHAASHVGSLCLAKLESALGSRVGARSSSRAGICPPLWPRHQWTVSYLQVEETLRSTWPCVSPWPVP